MSMKNSSDTIGDGTRGLPTSGTMSQPTAPLQYPVGTIWRKKKLLPLPPLEPRSLQPGSLIATPTALDSYVPTLLDKCSIITLRLYDGDEESKTVTHFKA